MNRVVIAPDSFKGSLTAAEAARAIAAGWRDVRPDDELLLFPMADGGEGTLEALAVDRPGVVWHTLRVTGPDGRRTGARWLELPGSVAAVELAESSGITKMPALDPRGATSRGLGEVLRAVALRQPARILLGLGGSASTDGGWGALSALGLQAFDVDGQPLPDGGAALDRLSSVDDSALVRLPPITLLADVDNPLLGPGGAAAVFGPQKGADDQDVMFLDACLARWAVALGGDHTLPGAGAAGGVGYGFMTVYGAQKASGAATVAESSGLADAVSSADVVITGEGRFDDSSLGGKVVGHVLSLTRSASSQPEVAVVAGALEREPDWGYSLVELAGSLGSALADPAAWLRRAGSLAATDRDFRIREQMR